MVITVLVEKVKNVFSGITKAATESDDSIAAKKTKKLVIKIEDVIASPVGISFKNGMQFINNC